MPARIGFRARCRARGLAEGRVESAQEHATHAPAEVSPESTPSASGSTVADGADPAVEVAGVIQDRELSRSHALDTSFRVNCSHLGWLLRCVIAEGVHLHRDRPEEYHAPW